MDTKEFLIVARETFDAIELRLDVLAVNDVDVLLEADSMLLLVNGSLGIRLVTDLAQSRIAATGSGAVTLFAYHDIEERWFSEDMQTELVTWLGVRISSLLGSTVDLRGD